MTDLRSLLTRTVDHVVAYRDRASEGPVFPNVDLDKVRAAIGGRLPDDPSSADEVVDQLIGAVEPAMVTTTGPRYFGFVIGGALDVATRGRSAHSRVGPECLQPPVVAIGRGRRRSRRLVDG